MILICLLAAIAVELHFKQGSEYRKFGWFNSLREYLGEIFAGKLFFDGWAGIVLVFLLPILALCLVLNIFDEPIFWPILLVISAVLLFYSLGPIPLEKSFSGYFEAMERGDLEAAHLHIQEQLGITDDEGLPENDELVRSTTRKILVESQKRYFGVITWFILLGPIGAMVYRLVHVYREMCAEEEFNEHMPLMESLIHWVDWLPSRATSFLFLLTGDFVNGFYRIKDYLADTEADNHQLISETGIAALGLEMGICDGSIEENEKAMAMVKRAIIFYLVIGAVATLIF